MERRLSALIVDDEAKALELLQSLLRDTGMFGDIRVAQSAATAWELLRHVQPELIFLDIKMPGKDGLTLLKEIQKKGIQTEIIFTTAFEQYALEAMRHHAFGYLLKPVNRKELSHCIDYYLKHGHQALPERLHLLLNEWDDPPRLKINTRTGYIFIPPHSILYCQADGNYTEIHLGDKKHVCSLQLGVLEKMLPGNGFIRLGRSLILNFSRVERVDRKLNLVTFEKEGHSYSLTLSRSQVRELERKQNA